MHLIFVFCTVIHSKQKMYVNICKPHLSVLPPNHFIHDARVALNDSGDLHGHIFSGIIRRRRTEAFRPLHPNSHLYTADAHVEAFPGRAFRIVEVYGFSKSELRRLSSALCAASAAAGRKSPQPAANLSVRNFPESVATLRARLKIREGGEQYLFATTRADGSKCLILCRAVG